MVRKHHTSNKIDAELPEEFGFHYPNNITDIWSMLLVLENFQKWPDEGGFLDQNAFLVDDILTLKAVKNWVEGQDNPKGDEE